MTQGELSTTMHVIVAGKVRAERTHPDLLVSVVLAELGPGEVVGEMGVLENEPRSATVTALEPTETVELSQEALMQTITRYPEVSTSLLRMLSRRIRSTDELMEKTLHQLPCNGTVRQKGPW
jgi:CRP-like cAMP-binding protein